MERLDFPGGLVQEMQVRSLDWEDPPEKEMATHSSILIWEIPWTEEPARLESMGLQMSWTWLRVTFGRQVVFEGKLGNIFLPCKYLPLDNGIISEDLL